MDFQAFDDCNAVDPATVPRRLRSGVSNKIPFLCLLFLIPFLIGSIFNRKIPALWILSPSRIVLHIALHYWRRVLFRENLLSFLSF